jgi:hypothetical protein
MRQAANSRGRSPSQVRRPRATGTRRPIVRVMFEWKPPDPRLVAFVRRLQETARRRFSRKSESPDSMPAIDDEIAAAGASNDALRDPSTPRGDPFNR